MGYLVTRLAILLALLCCFSNAVHAQNPRQFNLDPNNEFDPGMQIDPEMEFDFGMDGMEDWQSSPPSLDPSTGAAATLATMAIVVIGLVISLLLQAVVAYFLSSALKAVPEQYRELSPAIPWLLLVPFVNIVILFLAFIKVPRSLNKYLTSVGDTSQGDCGEQMGLWGAVLGIIPCTGPIGLILLIISLVKITQAKNVALAVNRAQPL